MSTAKKNMASMLQLTRNYGIKYAIVAWLEYKFAGYLTWEAQVKLNDWMNERIK